MITPFLNPAEMVDTGAQIAAWRVRYPQFDRMRDVPPVVARCVEPDARLAELLAMPRDLTPAEWAELTAFERASA